MSMLKIKILRNFSFRTILIDFKVKILFVDIVSLRASKYEEKVWKTFLLVSSSEGVQLPQLIRIKDGSISQLLLSKFG